MCGICGWWAKPKYSRLADDDAPVVYFLCSTCAAQSPDCSSCGGMAWRSRSQARWEQTLRLNIHRLGRHVNDVDTQLSFETFDIFLKELQGKCSNSGIGQLLSPKVLGHVEQFTSAISSMTQANQIACLIWGGLQAVLKVRTLRYGHGP